MNLALVALGVYSRVGGIEHYLQRVIQCLSEGADSGTLEVVILWDSPGDLPPALRQVGFSACGSNKLRAVAAFARGVRRLRPDVILYGHVLLAPLAGLARLLSPRSRHVLLSYGVEVWGEEARRMVRGWERLILGRWMDRIISISQFTADRMRQRYRLPAEVFTLIPCAVDVGPAPVRVPVRKHRGARLLTVSRLVERYKGWHQVVQALPRLLRRFPQVQYVVVGEGPLRGELESLAEQVGVADHVKFLGRVGPEDLERAYADADVFVMPSSGEGFGIVFLEAWAHGLPVVAGNRDAAAEFISPQVNGLTVNPDSTEEVAEALHQLLANPEQARRLGQAGYRQVSEQFSHRQFCDRLHELLREIA